MLKKGMSKTLDAQHNKMLATFESRYASVVEKRARLDELAKDLDALGQLSDLDETQIDTHLRLLEEKRAIEKEISDINSRGDELEYLLDTADIVFKYYDIIEKGHGNDNDILGVAMGKNSILQYFANKDNAPNEGGEDDEKVEEDRASLLERYMQQTDPNYIKSVDSSRCEKCPVCDSTERTVFVNDGICYCNDCYTIETIIVDHEKPSYKDPPKEISYFSYKRINHLNEWISQIQGKESTDIPTEIYDRILLEIKKQRITNMAEITTTKIKEILKRLSLNKYYEHVPHIMNRLNGTPGISFTPEIEEKLRQMFKMIQIPFFKHAPKNRKNFLSYSYTIHKCLQLLELDEYLKYFPLLKSREKTFQMDEVWQKICQELSWQFVSSL